MTKLTWEKQVEMLELSWNPTKPLALLVKRSSLWARETLFNVLGLPKSLEITITWFISRTTWSILLCWAQSTSYIKVGLNTPDILCLPGVLYNYTTTQLLWGVLEQFVLFDISMVINFWYGYMFIYTSIYLCLYRLPLFKYTHPYRDIEYLSNFFSELPAISELSLTKDITLSQKALPSTLFLHIDKGTSMVVLLRAKPRLSQHTTKNILFPSGTLIFGLLWVTKHH